MKTPTYIYLVQYREKKTSGKQFRVYGKTLRIKATTRQEAKAKFLKTHPEPKYWIERVSIFSVL